MPCTISQLLANPSLGLTLLTSGPSTAVEVTWAHTSELPDPTPWLEGGELLMTLGVLLPPDPAAQDAYVARLARAGVAALAVDVGIIHDEVPSTVALSGERHGLPVLRIPASTPFLAISKAVISALTADSVHAVAEVSRRQERIAAAAVSSGAAGVVRTLSPLLGCDVAVVTVRGAIVEAAGPGSSRLRDQVIERIGGRSRGARPALTFTHVDDEGVITSQALPAELGAPLVLATRSTKPFTTHERLVVSHAAHLLALTLRTPDRIREVESRLRRAVGRTLVTGATPPDPQVLQLLGFRPRSPVAVTVVQAGVRRADAATMAERFLLARGTAYLLCTLGRGVALVLPAPGAAELVLQLRRALGALLDSSVVAGLSDPVAPDQLAEGVAQAGAAARAAAREHAEVVSYGELGPLEIFLRTQPRDVLEAMAFSVLRPLLDWDAEQGSALIDTVSAFLEHNGRAEGTAKALGIHRHTLRQRLDRIAVLLGRSLENPELRADLWVALRARSHVTAGVAHNAGVAHKAEAPK